MAGNANTIALKVFGGEHREGIANDGDIYPGMALLIVGTTGKIDKFTPAVDTPYPSLIALEDALQGRDIDTVYATATPIFYRVPAPGEEFQLRMAASMTIVIGDYLKREAATGNFIKATAATDPGPWVAMEARTTVSAGEHIRCMYAPMTALYS